MAERPPHTPSAGLLLLAGLLAAGAWPVARLLTAAQGDLGAQLSAAVLAGSLACGAWGFALLPHLHARERASRARRAAGLIAALALAPAAWAWTLLLAGGWPLIGAALLAAALAAAGFAFAAEWSLAGARAAHVASAWFAAAALGWGATLFTTGAAPLDHLPGARLDGARAGAARLESGLAALGLRTRPERVRWDALGRVQSLALLDARAQLATTGLALRDGALGGALLGGASPVLAEACASHMLGIPAKKPRRRVLLAGFGSGAALACALRGGANHVDIAEPSAALAEVAGGFIGAAARDPRVRVHRVSARAWVRSARNYDLIAFEDAPAKHTWPPGLLPLPEATLATDRGLAALLDALRPDGVLQITLRGEPRALRFANTARAALSLLGADPPEAHIAVQSAGDSYGISIGRLPLGIDAVLDLHRVAKPMQAAPAATAGLDRALAALLGLPHTPARLEFTAGAAFQNRFGVLFGAGGSRFVDAYAFDLSPPTDDRPLFDRLSRQADWEADPLFRGLLGGAGLGWLLALVALALLGMRLRPHGALRSALAFGSVGAAQVLLYAWLAHVLALLIPRPEIGLALAALAWPLLALAAAPLPVGGTPTFAFAAQALAAAASVVLPVLVVLAYGYRALLLSAVLLLLVAAAATWVGRSRA